MMNQLFDANAVFDEILSDGRWRGKRGIIKEFIKWFLLHGCVREIVTSLGTVPVPVNKVWLESLAHVVAAGVWWPWLEERIKSGAVWVRESGPYTGKIDPSGEPEKYLQYKLVSAKTEK